METYYDVSFSDYCWKSIKFVLVLMAATTLSQKSIFTLVCRIMATHSFAIAWSMERKSKMS